MSVTISGIPVSVMSGSLSVNDRIGERSTCRFVAMDEAGTAHYQRGQPVAVSDLSSNLIFSGYIDSAPETYTGPAGGLRHSISCMDNHYLADKRVAIKAYTDTSAGDIVQDLLTEYLAEEGVTVGNIEAGPTFRAAVFNYIPVSRALQQLAERAGYWWRIDHEKQIWFEPPSAQAAPWHITQSGGVADDVLHGSAEVVRANPLYRNRQYIRGSRDETDEQVEILPGDGDTRAFPVGYPVARVPTVEVNRDGAGYAAETVGIKGLDSGRQWYWSKGDPIIVHDDGEVVLTSTDRVRITYRGRFDVVVRSHDQAAVTERQGVEGGTGIVEDVHQVSAVDNRAQAFELAAEKLNRYAHVNQVLRFATRRPGLRPGHEINVTLAQHGLDGENMLIESVQITDRRNQMVYEVQAADHPTGGSWAKFFETLAEQGDLPLDPERLGTDEILALLESFPESWSWGETVTPHVYACPVPATDLYPSTTLYPC